MAACRWPEEKALAEDVQVPGPQDYDIGPPAVQGPAFTIGAKHATGPASDIPGPGEHELKELPKGPAYTIAGRHVQDSAAASSSPGPAAYEAQVRSNSTDE